MLSGLRGAIAAEEECDKRGLPIREQRASNASSSSYLTSFLPPSHSLLLPPLFSFCDKTLQMPAITPDVADDPQPEPQPQPQPQSQSQPEPVVVTPHPGVSFIVRPFPPPSLVGVPVDFVVSQLRKLAPHFWNKSESGDCTVSMCSSLPPFPHLTMLSSCPNECRAPIPVPQVQQWGVSIPQVHVRPSQHRCTLHVDSGRKFHWPDGVAPLLSVKAPRRRMVLKVSFGLLSS